MAKRVQGRGQLDAFELLPSVCDPVIAWASDELRNRERTQTDIYREFFERMEAVQKEHRGEIEFSIPSFSAFNRMSIRLATMTRRLEETRDIAAAISERFDAKASDDLTLIAAEAIKSLIFELLTTAPDQIDPKGAMQLAAALRSASQAQGVSTSRRQAVEGEFKSKVDAALDAAEKVNGGKPEASAVLKRIREDVYGIFEVPSGGV